MQVCRFFPHSVRNMGCQSVKSSMQSCKSLVDGKRPTNHAKALCMIASSPCANLETAGRHLFGSQFPTSALGCYFIAYNPKLSLPYTRLVLILIITSGLFIPVVSQCRRPRMLQSYSYHWSGLPRVQVRLMALVPSWLLPSVHSCQQIQRRSHDVKREHQRRHESNGRHNEQIFINSISLKTSLLGTS